MRFLASFTLQVIRQQNISVTHIAKISHNCVRFTISLSRKTYIRNKYILRRKSKPIKFSATLMQNHVKTSMPRLQTHVHPDTSADVKRMYYV